jgi:hypothetical protein
LRKETEEERKKGTVDMGSSPDVGAAGLEGVRLGAQLHELHPLPPRRTLTLAQARRFLLLPMHYHHGALLPSEHGRRERKSPAAEQHALQRKEERRAAVGVGEGRED